MYSISKSKALDLLENSVLEYHGYLFMVMCGEIISKNPFVLKYCPDKYIT